MTSARDAALPFRAPRRRSRHRTWAALVQRERGGEEVFRLDAHPLERTVEQRPLAGRILEKSVPLVLDAFVTTE